MHFQAWIHGTKRRVPHVIDPQSGASHQYDFSREGSFGQLSVKNVTDRVMGKRLGWAEEIDEHFRFSKR